MMKKWNLQNPLVRKQLAALLSLALVLLCFVGTTLAYVIAKAGPLTNLFQPVQVSCNVDRANAKITNTSDIPVYLRIAVTATCEKSEGGTVVTHWENPVLTVAPGDNWIKVGDFYYYKSTVASKADVILPGITTSGTADGYEPVTRVLAEVIQSEPDDAVENAWKMVFNNGNWTPKA